ncbi:cytochrome C oxidase subunit IV family protein [Thalassobacillus sp. CUG 92003]|uniref:cytochrome C oxidase subunit IV family protein n=1 Tax=Thalassobacillus sp. CUG 92003 TaxID=2736641 RepID=UPI0015E6E1E4|nr:cytochrome C oxidase subunit IV family protein [Thalassobacillus sp. CUG 92003]
MTEQRKRIPVQHLVGFVLSIALTLLAAWAALGSGLPTLWIIIAILTLAVIQAGIQLFMFMHMVEFKSQNGHVPWNMMLHGFVLAAILVAGSLFTMSFGFSHDHDEEDHNQHEQQEQQEQHGGH